MNREKTQTSVFLLMPEIATYGGVQSYMKRLVDVFITQMPNHPLGISLNDSNLTLNKAKLAPLVTGCKRNKFRFIYKAISHCPKQSVVISGHIGISPVGMLLKIIGRARKHIIILHGIEAWQRASWIKYMALKYADLIIATTNYTKKLCAKENKLEIDKFKVIPLCCEQVSIEPDPDFVLEGEFKVLTVGRMARSEQYKGFDTLIRAISELKHKGEPANLYLVGDGDDRSRLEALSQELEVYDRINFLGQLSDKELQGAYASCDVFAMPSKNEGFGIVFLEAMRHGKPCIGGNHRGMSEIIIHNKSGYLVYGDDSNVLARYLSILNDDKDIRNLMGKMARNNYKKKYTFDIYKNNFQSIFN